VEQLSIRELEKLTIPPVEKIHMYQAFNLPKSLLLTAFIELTTRPEPLNLEEGQKLGVDTSVKIARARELSRGSSTGKGPRGPSSIQVRDAELQSLVQEAFGLGEARPNGRT
jgi:hypothetical protein